MASARKKDFVDDGGDDGTVPPPDDTIVPDPNGGGTGGGPGAGYNPDPSGGLNTTGFVYTGPAGDNDSWNLSANDRTALGLPADGSGDSLFKQVAKAFGLIDSKGNVNAMQWAGLIAPLVGGILNSHTINRSTSQMLQANKDAQNTVTNAFNQILGTNGQGGIYSPYTAAGNTATQQLTGMMGQPGLAGAFKPLGSGQGLAGYAPNTGQTLATIMQRAQQQPPVKPPGS